MKYKAEKNGGIELHLDDCEKSILYKSLERYQKYAFKNDMSIELAVIGEMLDVLDR